MSSSAQGSFNQKSIPTLNISWVYSWLWLNSQVPNPPQTSQGCKLYNLPNSTTNQGPSKCSNPWDYEGHFSFRPPHCETTMEHKQNTRKQRLATGSMSLRWDLRVYNLASLLISSLLPLCRWNVINLISTPAPATMPSLPCLHHGHGCFFLAYFVTAMGVRG